MHTHDPSTPAPCPRCGRALTETASGLRCTSWSCNRSPAATSRVGDMQKIRAGIDLIGALDVVRRTAAEAVAHIATAGNSGDAPRIVQSLEHGIARVTAAARPVEEAIAAWRAPAAEQPENGSPKDHPEAILDLEPCPRCGAFVAGPCSCERR